jgi:hypothetical protein
MNRDRKTRPRMKAVEQFAKLGPVGVLKFRCTTRSGRTYRCRRTRRCVPNGARAFVADLGRATPSICSSLSLRQAHVRSGPVQAPQGCRIGLLLAPQVSCSAALSSARSRNRLRSGSIELTGSIQAAFQAACRRRCGTCRDRAPARLAQAWLGSLAPM